MALKNLEQRGENKRRGRVCEAAGANGRLCWYTKFSQATISALVKRKILHCIHIHLTGSQGNGESKKSEDDHHGRHGANVL